VGKSERAVCSEPRDFTGLTEEITVNRNRIAISLLKIDCCSCSLAINRCNRAKGKSRKSFKEMGSYTNTGGG
jgi:hypothetical protein